MSVENLTSEAVDTIDIRGGDAGIYLCALEANEEVVSRREQERRLIASFKAGDKQAFEGLYSLYAPVVGRYLTKMIDSETAADICQETFLRFYTHIDRFEDKGNGVLPWLYTVGRNLVRDEVCNNLRHIRLVDTTDEAFWSIPAPDDTEKIVIGRLVLRSTTDAIARLGGNDKEVILEMGLQEKTATQYAADKHMPMNAAKQQLHRACGRLRLAMDGWDT